MNSKHGFEYVGKSLNIKLIYHVIMILLVTHDDRGKSIGYLRSHPKELPALFRIKVKEANLNFSDQFPQTIDLQMIRELCDEIKNYSADEDYQNLVKLIGPPRHDVDQSLVMELADIQDDETILNADFSYSYLLINILENNPKQVVFEQVKSTCYDFMLATVYLKNDPNVHLYCEHGIDEVKQQFDKAVASFAIDTLTLGLYDDLHNHRSNRHENFYKDYENIKSSMDKLKPDGCGFFAILSDRLRFNNPIKRELVDKNLIATVIQLGMMDDKRWPAILVLDKNKKTNEIRFIDASKFDLSKKNSEIDDIKKRIINAVHRKTNYAGFVRNVDVDEVVDRNYNLLSENYVNTFKGVDQYLTNSTVKVNLTELNNIKTIKLGEIAEISENFAPFTTSKYGKSYRIVKFIEDGNFDLAGTIQKHLSGFSKDVNLVKKSDILVLIHSNISWRISYVEKEPINTIYDGMTIRVKDTRFNSEWLSQYLRSFIAQEQYFVRQNDLMEIDKQALLNIKIPWISLERQTTALKNYYKKMNIIKATRQELNDELSESRSELYGEMNLDQFFK